MTISDAAAFEKMLTSGKTPQTVQTKDGIKFIAQNNESRTNSEEGLSYGKKSGIVAWNEKMAIIGGNMGENTEGSSVLNYFKNKADQSIVKNENFNKLFSEPHDIYTYANFDKIADNPSVKGGAGMMNQIGRAHV